MLPTLEEQNNKVKEIYDNLNTDNIKEPILVVVSKQYAKWYAEQVIKHCSEVADVEFITSNGGCCSTDKVDKQSILNIINEL